MQCGFSLFEIISFVLRLSFSKLIELLLQNLVIFPPVHLKLNLLWVHFFDEIFEFGIGVGNFATITAFLLAKLTLIIPRGGNGQETKRLVRFFSIDDFLFIVVDRVNLTIVGVKFVVKLF